eukprot:gene7846-5647_t
MAATCSHQDPERNKVSASAHGVASLRGMEMKRGPEERVFDDPYAEMLGGQVGPKWIQFMEDAYFEERPDKDTRKQGGLLSTLGNFSRNSYQSN